MAHFRIAEYLCATFFLMHNLVGCAAIPVVAGMSPVVMTEVLPRAINGKGLAEDGADLATHKDCRLIEGVTRKDRKICEDRNSPQTRKDFKGLSSFNH